MNLSQFCNIILFSKPAARHTNKDRLLCSTTSTSGGRFAPTMSAGFTLLEVLVAMVILLVGIWTLAVSFPKLLGVIATQEKHTEMAQQAQRTINQLTRHPADLPLATRGDTFNLGYLGAASINATGKPQDPSISDLTITPGNARDDMIEVIGERFTVPAPSPSTAGPVYVFRQGLAEPGATFVYQVFQATIGEPQPWEAQVSIDSGGTLSILQLPNNAYIGDPLALDPVTPWTAYVSYTWVPPNPGPGDVHHVSGEEVPVGGQVMAALHPDFAQIIDYTPQEVRAYYDLPIASIVQHDSGALLAFPPNFTGARLGVNYVLRTEPLRNSRRALIMSEQHRIVSVPQDITLVGSHIDDEVPLPVGLAEDTYVLAVDTSTGDLYAEGTGLELLDAGAGKIRLGETVWRGVKGHDLRFYYVTLDQDLISVQAAPAAFLDWNVVDAAVNNGTPTQVEYATKQYYRTYDVTPNGAYTDLLFYPCNAGHTVAVDYTYIDAGGVKREVRGEMHTINTEDYHVTLQPPHAPAQPPPPVEEIIAVRGKSLQAIAWWRTPTGRLERLEINTVR